MFFNFLSLTLLLSTWLTTANGRNTLARSNFLPDGYTMSTLKLRGSIGNLPNISIEGRDIHEIITKLQARYPYFEVPSSHAMRSSKLSSALVPRNKNTAQCCPVVGQPDWIPAYRSYIKSAYKLLYGMHSRCGVNAKSCVRLTCQNSHAIFLCNDNPHYIEPDCGYLASYAESISNECVAPSADNPKTLAVCGQESDSDNYRVIVARQMCFNPSDSPPGGSLW